MIKIFIYIVSLPILLAAVALLPWPEIPQEAFDVLANFFNILWQLNQYLPVDTFLTFAGYALTIKILIFTVKLMDSARTAITGGQPLFTFKAFRDNKKDDD